MRLTTLAVAKLISKTRPVKSILAFAETIASHEELRRAVRRREEMTRSLLLDTKSSSRKDRGRHGLARALLYSDSYGARRALNGTYRVFMRWLKVQDHR